MAARLQRVPNWRPRLAAYIAAVQRMHFSWDPDKVGAVNCITYSCKAIQVQTGYDIYAQVAKLVKPDYHDEASALTSLDQIFGSHDVEGVYDQFFQTKEVVGVQLGDIVLVEINGVRACAVMMNPFAYAMTLTGTLLHVPMSKVVKAYDPLSFSIPEKYTNTSTSTSTAASPKE